MTISIAMATYNGERFLPTQLDSIATQTRLPDELVISDDGSSDSTIEIVEKFAAYAPFKVTLLKNLDRLGSIKNFERALTQCSGEIIALSDQDDLWLPEKLETQGGFLESNPDLGGAFSDAYLMNDQSTRTGETLWATNNFDSADQEELHSGNTFARGITGKKTLGCTLMFKSYLLEKIVPIPSIWEHDSWIAWMIAIYSRLDIIPEKLIQYRIHSAQQFGVARLPLASHLKTNRSRYLEYAEQLTAILHRLEKSAPPDGRILPQLEMMIRRSEMRGNLPRNPARRALTVISNWNQYPQSFGGALSALKDLVGPMLSKEGG